MTSASLRCPFSSTAVHVHREDGGAACRSTLSPGTSALPLQSCVFFSPGLRWGVPGVCIPLLGAVALPQDAVAVTAPWQGSDLLSPRQLPSPCDLEGPSQD